MIKTKFLIGLGMIFSLFAQAQNTSISNWRDTLLTITEEITALDSLTIIPTTVDIFDSENGNKFQQGEDYEIQNNSIVWDADLPQTLEIRYRVLPYDIGARQNHLDTSFIRSFDEGTYIGSDYTPYQESQDLLDFKGLNYNGSFARGISVGNAQNLVLNSSFNLQLAGNLGDDVEILAAITDSNIPLQPEGNTQQLNEFDKIFIQLKRKNNTLLAGDYELSRPTGYFMNYYKKLQGASFTNESQLFSKGTLRSKASVAIARGKFARNIIAQQEGNQGPYKLEGGEGEAFIIVLAGTEKVYIDGELLKRGLEEDYIIDYNQGEVTFTTRRLITKDKRIIVEFEYADQNYLRSMYGFNSEYQQENMKIYFNVFSEQDGKNSNNGSELTAEARQAFINAGDKADSIFLSPAIDTLEEGFNGNFVMYKLIDTTLNGQYFPNILVYSTNADSARFVANFLDVGAGNGDYVQIPSTANGRVYQWSPPDVNGNLTGNFRNVRKLVAPNRQQMYNAGTEIKVGKKGKVIAEVAMSNSDPNRFSELDSNNDVGLGTYARYTNEFNLDKEEYGWKLKTDLSHEYAQENFEDLNPYRNAEFVRDWNLNGLNLNEADEHLSNVGATISKSKIGRLEYRFSNFLKGSAYSGSKHTGGGQIKYKDFEVTLSASLLNSSTALEKTNFFRPKIDISKRFKVLNNWKLGVYGEREKNSRVNAVTDTLQKNSFYYDVFRSYIESPTNDKYGLNASYGQRLDYAPTLEQFKKATTADEVNVNGFWNQKKGSRLSWDMTWRKLVIDDQNLTEENPQETYLGRVDYRLELFERMIRSNTSYEIGSGQQPKLEEYYLPVNPGEGVYKWNNLNGDDVVQQDEVQLAAFQSEADLIKLTRATNEFIRTNNVSLNQSIRLEPKASWRQAEDFKKSLSKFSIQSTFRIVRRTLEGADVQVWNPLQLNLVDSTLVAVSSSIRNTLFFNRGNPKYDMELGQSNSRNKRILTTGFESISRLEYFFRTRWNISNKLSTIVRLAQEESSNDIELFDTRDYRISGYKAEPSFTYLPKKNLRFILAYKYQDSENILEMGGETAIFHDLNLEFTLNQTSASSIRAKVSFVQIEFVGEANSPIEFAMLEGLKNGENYLWNIRYDRQIGKNIQLSLLYEGRQTGMADMIHTGNAQVRATF